MNRSSAFLVGPDRRAGRFLFIFNLPFPLCALCASALK